MTKFIRENLVLVAGIVLPVLLIIGFLILAHLPKAMLTPPQYDFLVVGYRYDHQHQRNYYLSFEIKNNKLQGIVTPKDNTSTYHNRQHASLFLYNLAEDRFTEISYRLPEEVDNLEQQTFFAIPELERHEFSENLVSPDGYRFEYLGHRGRGGLLGEIFGMGRRHTSQYVLTKNSAHVELPFPATQPHYYYSHNLSFLGWIVSEGN